MCRLPMGLPELGPYANRGGHSGQKYGNDFTTRASEFDATLEKLSPHLLARLSLQPGAAFVLACLHCPDCTCTKEQVLVVKVFSSKGHNQTLSRAGSK